MTRDGVKACGCYDLTPRLSVSSCDAGQSGMRAGQLQEQEKGMATTNEKKKTGKKEELNHSVLYLMFAQHICYSM